MATYTNEQLLEILKKEGADTSQFGKSINRPESEERAGLANRVPQPLEIMSTATALGVQIPWGKIGAFLLCVAKSVWTKPLPEAILACAKTING